MKSQPPILDFGDCFEIFNTATAYNLVVLIMIQLIQNDTPTPYSGLWGIF